MNGHHVLNRMRGGRVGRLVCLLLAIIFLNFSVDPRDRLAVTLPEDLSVNDMESLLELALEDIMGIDDCIPESDENDLEKNGGSKRVDSSAIWFACLDIKLALHSSIETSRQYLRDADLIPSRASSIHSPPPEFS